MNSNQEQRWSVIDFSLTQNDINRRTNGPSHQIGVDSLVNHLAYFVRADDLAR